MRNTRITRKMMVTSGLKRRMKVLFAIAVGGALIAGTGIALAAEFKIGQAGQKFSERKIDATVGDTLHFVNDDNVVHQVTINELGVDSGAMDPGAEYSTTLSESGEFKVRCSIHPRMRIKLTVQ